MEQRKIGDFDLHCSTIGYETWEISVSMYDDIDVDAVTHAIPSASHHGTNLFDTAEG